MSSLTSLRLQIEQRLPGGRKWLDGPKQGLWTDRPDALELLEAGHAAGRYSDRERDQLRGWIEHGYLLLDGAAPLGDIDGLNRDVDAVWTADRAQKGLNISGVLVGGETGSKDFSHAALLEIPEQDRLALRDKGSWRIGGLHDHSRAARRLMNNMTVAKLAAKIFDWRSRPRYSICFYYGSEQSVHQDAAVFHVRPPNYVIGAWIACEDITEESGPLVYHPGSHREPLYPGFDNYPYTNLRTASDDQAKSYQRYVTELAARYPAKPFLAKKGQVFLWHAQLLHGGSPRRDPKRTRRSFVVHHMAVGADRHAEITGPTRW